MSEGHAATACGAVAVTATSGATSARAPRKGTARRRRLEFRDMMGLSWVEETAMPQPRKTPSQGASVRILNPARRPCSDPLQEGATMSSKTAYFVLMGTCIGLILVAW